MMHGRNSDFWWLTLEEAEKYKYVYVCHREPYSDEPYTNRDPLSVRQFYSLDKSGRLSTAKKRHPLQFIHQWREKCANINVFRGLNLYSVEEGGEEILGPFVIDIDRQEKTDESYIQNLNKALEDARLLVNKYLRGLAQSDFCIFFTGHKGFNIEVRPRALGISSERQFRDKLRDINRTLGDNGDSNFVDNFHDELRLHNSINKWIGNDGRQINRMKFELSLNELNSLDINEICRRSERLALTYLSKKWRV